MPRQSAHPCFYFATLLSLATACAPGPDDAVRELGEAFKNGDKLGVEARMDVQRTVSSAIDQSFEATMGHELSKSHSPFDSAGTVVGGVMATAIKPMIVGGITSGINSFASGGPLSFPILGIAEEVPRDSTISAFRSAYKGIVKTEVRDRLALVTIRLGQPDGDSIDMTLRLERGDGGWRVVGLDNLAPLLGRFQRAQGTGRRHN